jgi:hypothetical protein
MGMKTRWIWIMMEVFRVMKAVLVRGVVMYEYWVSCGQPEAFSFLSVRRGLT